MAVVRDKGLVEDLDIGFGSATITGPAGGSLVGTKIHMGSLMGGTHIESFAASLTIDLANGTHQQVTLTGDVTDSSITTTSGSVSGPILLVLEIIQDSTGGRLFNWPTNVVNGGTYPVDTTANYRSQFLLFYNGSNWSIFSNAILTS